MSENLLEQYQGKGRKGAESVKRIAKPASLRDPECYEASPELRAAVNVAIALGQPLLLTGEPGTGKTDLAASVAWELNLPLHTFPAKTTSAARDLFYRYDALSHFHDAHLAKPGEQRPDAAGYIAYDALGLAILMTHPEKYSKEKIHLLLPEKWRNNDPQTCVVLVDEVDKAPRDFPNDMLVEVERMKFTVRETGQEFVAREEHRPILILTSNSEKNLPPAFLRRCVFHHLKPPSMDDLKKILAKRLQGGFTGPALDHAVELFDEIRQIGLKKQPSTGEFLSWAEILSHRQIDVKNLKNGEAEVLAMSYATLVKTEDDSKKFLNFKPK